MSGADFLILYDVEGSDGQKAFVLVVNSEDIMTDKMSIWGSCGHVVNELCTHDQSVKDVFVCRGQRADDFREQATDTATFLWCDQHRWLNDH